MKVSRKPQSSWATSIIDLSALMLTFFAATLAMSELPGRKSNSEISDDIKLEAGLLQNDLLAKAPELGATSQPSHSNRSAYLTSAFAAAVAEAVDDQKFAWQATEEGGLWLSKRTVPASVDDIEIVDELLRAAHRIRQTIPSTVHIRFDQAVLASTQSQQTYLRLIDQLQFGDQIVFFKNNGRGSNTSIMKFVPK